jgi:hypothetical protein
MKLLIWIWIYLTLAVATALGWHDAGTLLDYLAGGWSWALPE